LVKKCFIIGPIGNDNSLTRENANKLLEYIIKPVLDDLKYESPSRSDYLNQPGLITSQIINGINEAGFVIADLTGHNPNVYYELGFCHTINKPTILMQSDNTNLPFDVGGIRTIFYNFDVSKVNEVKENLKSHILNIENKNEFYNPISFSINFDDLKTSTDDIMNQTIIEIFSEIKEIKKTIDIIKSTSGINQSDIPLNFAVPIDSNSSMDSKPSPIDSRIYEWIIKSFINSSIFNGNNKK
jgi:nucleoside 2-deoxyribosyltransferase